MPPMSAEETETVLLAGTKTAKLATTKADGQPQTTPVWFLLDGDEVVLTTWH